MTDEIAFQAALTGNLTLANLDATPFSAGAVSASDAAFLSVGIHAFGHPRSTPELYLVNARCLDDFDLETEEYEVKLFDGRNWEAAFKARQESG